MDQLTVVLVGGGTGGHIFPLVSLKKALEKKGVSKFAWVGESDSLEERTAKKEAIPFHAVRSGKLRRYFSFRTLVEPVNVLVGCFQSFSLLRDLKPDFVFSKGGYVSIPVAIAAKFLRIPVYLHESDAIPGLANRLVGKFSKTVFLGFEAAKGYFSNCETMVVGQLLNPEIDWAELRDARYRNLETREKTPNVLVVCGSLGSSRVFDAVLTTASALPDVRFEIVLWTLNAGYREPFSKLSNVACHDFLSQSEMAEAYGRADVAITRAGATTLWELHAAGIRMLVIPLEESANGHQWANARAFCAMGEAVLPEKELANMPDVLPKILLRRAEAQKNPPSRGVAEVAERLLAIPKKP